MTISEHYINPNKVISAQHNHMKTISARSIQPQNVYIRIVLKSVFLRASNRKLWFGSWHSCFVFGRSSVQTSCRRPILTQVFVIFLRLARTNHNSFFHIHSDSLHIIHNISGVISITFIAENVIETRNYKNRTYSLTFQQN
jgi:hypothetical protein